MAIQTALCERECRETADRLATTSIVRWRIERERRQWQIAACERRVRELEGLINTMFSEQESAHGR